MSAVLPQEFELRPVGGVQVRNSRRELVYWFKGKDPESQPSFGICFCAPERADTPEKGRAVRKVFAVMIDWARRVGLPVFDAADLEKQIAIFLRELGAQSAAARREEEITVRVLELTTRRRVKLTLGVKPADAKNEWTVLPPTRVD